MTSHPVDVIIPHYKGSERLLKCLEKLFETDYADFRVLLVDNGCIDGSTEEAERRYPQVRILRLHQNLGFAGGCNAGIRASDREFVALLNDDTEVDPGWLKEMFKVIESDENIAAVQPKLRWIEEQNRFDYAGGMGGLIDVFGFPFCFGRMFETKEIDEGQYDWVQDIFWASGSACLFRRTPYLAVGGLDEKYFAHQEEIDLNWRLQLMGYRIAAAPSALVYHYGGGTLSATTLKKKYLNHRNSLMTLIKNYEITTLLWVMPIRIGLEIAAGFLAIKQGDIRRISAIIGAAAWIIIHLPILIWQRRGINAMRKVSDGEIMNRMYHGSAALQYYLFAKKTYYSLIEGGRNFPIVNQKKSEP